MKFLDYAPLVDVNAFLKRVDCGEVIVEGIIEAYSCKLAGLDKKMSRSLEESYIERLQSGALASGEVQNSPVGPLTDANSRKTLIYLILTLNHVYPDYDFTSLKSEQFTKEPSLWSVRTTINDWLVDVSRVWGATHVHVGESGGGGGGGGGAGGADGGGGGASNFVETLWSVLDEGMTLKECEVYSYVPAVDGDPFADRGNVWSFNYFFYNKKLKRILYFACRSASRASTLSDGDGSSSWESDDDDGGGGRQGRARRTQRAGGRGGGGEDASAGTWGDEDEERGSPFKAVPSFSPGYMGDIYSDEEGGLFQLDDGALVEGETESQQTASQEPSQGGG